MPMSSRDPWFDNAKMALVTLAVLGHAWSLLPMTPTNQALYDFLYVWHMPAFVMVSGYLSQRFDWSARRLWSLVTTLVVPYLVFATALAWFEVRLGWSERVDLYLVPIWPLWYLVALVTWRLAAPVFRSLPVPVAVGAAVAVSLGGGLLELPYLSLSKVVGMLPFFVVGLLATPERVAQVRGPSVQLAGGTTLVLTAFLVRDLDSWAGTLWLYYRGYDEVGADGAHGVAVRAALLLLGLGCALGVLSLVPGDDGWFSRMGSATMVVFLLHGFVVRAVDAMGFKDWAAVHTSLGPAVVVVGAVGLALALATPRSVRLFTPVVDPWGWWRGRSVAPAAPVAPPQAGRERLTAAL